MYLKEKILQNKSARASTREEEGIAIRSLYTKKIVKRQEKNNEHIQNQGSLFLLQAHR